MHQLAALPNISHARLPVIYEQAKTALIECAHIDECAKWANKAEALASYAKQAEDSSLRKMADRIQARAIRRCGKLLKEIKPAKGGDRKSKGGCPPVDSRKAAAKKAGMSEHQTKQAIRVAGIPEEDFEAAVESETPPTVTELAERGTQQQVLDLEGRSPDDFKAATESHGAIRRLADCAARVPALQVVRGTLSNERSHLRERAEACLAWLTQLIHHLEE